MNDIPYSLNLFLTGKCNLACRYCFVDRTGLETATLDEKSLRKGVDILFNYSGRKKTISFVGGEPTTEFALVKKITGYARQKAEKKGINLDAAVMTNGTLLNAEMMDYFKKNKVTVKISVDGDKKSHDKNRPFSFYSKKNSQKSSFDKIVRNLDNLETEGLKLAATMVFTPQNINRFFKNLNFLYNKNFYYIEFYPELYGKWQKNDLKKMRKILMNFVYYYVNLFRENKRVFKNSLLDGFLNESCADKPLNCPKIHLDPRGIFYVCEKALSIKPEEREKYAAGNARLGIDDKKRASILKRLRSDFYEKSGLKCAECGRSKQCFCPLGHYIYFLHQGADLKKAFSNFCELNKIYFDAFQAIKNKLKYHPKFVELYQSG